MTAVEHIRSSPYPYDARAPLDQAMKILKELLAFIRESKGIGEKLIKLVKAEGKLLKKEREMT